MQLFARSYTKQINNPQFGYGNRGDRIFDDDFFIFANEDNLTSRKTWGMLTENSTLKSLNELKDILGERLTQEKYDSIKVGWKRAKKNTKYCRREKRYEIRGFHELGQKGVKMF